MDTEVRNGVRYVVRLDLVCETCARLHAFGEENGSQSSGQI